MGFFTLAEDSANLRNLYFRLKFRSARSKFHEQNFKCPVIGQVNNLVIMSLMFPIYFLSLILSAGLTLLSAYKMLELSDLDCDYINPQRCCANLNRLVLPEILCVGLIFTLHLLTINWIPTATTLPMLAWLIFTYRSTPRGYVNLFDSTNICDQRVLNKHVRQCLFNIAFHLLHFLAYMYMAIISLITA